MVHGELDWIRRRQLMDHHTVHIVGGQLEVTRTSHLSQVQINQLSLRV